MKPVFSFIVPIYNVENYIDKCIQSLQEQTIKNYEIILIDDGSMDRCGQICDSYAAHDKRIKVIHKGNGGLVSARKAGAIIAEGEYTCCVDGDDFIDNAYLESLLNIIESYNPEVICFNYYNYSANGCKAAKPYDGYDLGLYDKDKIIGKIFPNLICAMNGTYFLPAVWAKAFRTDLYKDAQLKVDDRITMGEDGACVIPIMVNANSVYITNKPLYYYRYNDQSMTKGRKTYQWENQKLIGGILADMPNNTSYDFTEQIYRRIEKGFFTTAKSKFNDCNNYRIIKADIIEQMSGDVFSAAIEKSRFKDNYKTMFMDFCLKNRLILPIYLLNKFL